VTRSAGEVRITTHIRSDDGDHFDRWLAEYTGGRAAARFGAELFIDMPDK